MSDRAQIAIRTDLHRRVKVRASSEGKTLQEMLEQLAAFGLRHMGANGKPKIETLSTQK